MLHDPWFWVAAVLALIVAAIVGLFVWAARHGPPEPKPDFDAVLSIGNMPGKVYMEFSRSMTSLNLDTQEARHMASVVLRAADDAERRADEQDNIRRVTSWERINRD